MLTRISILFSLVLTTTTVIAQNSKSSNSPLTGPEIENKVDDYIHLQMEQQRIPGVALAVVKNGEIIYTKGYGYANLEHMVPVRPETIFQSGSVGKAFTVMGIMMLIEKGEISLDDKLTTYFPEGPKEWDQITIRHILEHTSGLTSGYPEDFNFQKDYTDEELYNLYKAEPIAFKPGEKRGYSNIGYDLLGFIITKVTGKFYGEYLKEKVFDPLGMNATGVISEADIVPHRASGYRIQNGEIKNQEWVAPAINTLASGSLYVNVLDIAKWEVALQSRKLLQPSSYESMWKPVITNSKEVLPFGFSWQLTDIFSKRLVEHSGGWQGFNAHFSRYPEQQTTFIVFTNLRGVNPIALTRGLQYIYHPELSMRNQKALPNQETKVTAIAKEVIQKIVDRQLKPEMFKEGAGENILPYGDQAGAMFKSFGNLDNIELIYRKKEDDGNLVYQYRLTYGEKKLLFFLGLTDDHKISLIDLEQ